MPCAARERYLVRRWGLHLNIIFASPCRRRSRSLLRSSPGGVGTPYCRSYFNPFGPPSSSGKASKAPRSGRLGCWPRRCSCIHTHARTLAAPRCQTGPASRLSSLLPVWLASLFPFLVDSRCAGSSNHRLSLVAPVMTAQSRDGVAAPPVRKKKRRRRIPSTAAAGCARLASPSPSAAIYLPRQLLPLWPLVRLPTEAAMIPQKGGAQKRPTNAVRPRVKRATRAHESHAIRRSVQTVTASNKSWQQAFLRKLRKALPGGVFPARYL